ncbi:hypothetical protein BAE44_0022176, partial [Dichanthelium oligosanthes]
MRFIEGSLCISDLQRVAYQAEATQANLSIKEGITCLHLKWDINQTIRGKYNLFGKELSQYDKGQKEPLHVSLLQKNFTPSDISGSVVNPSEVSPPDPAINILECLHPPRYLQKLKIFGYPGCSFPDWVQRLRYIQVIEISHCIELQKEDGGIWVKKKIQKINEYWQEKTNEFWQGWQKYEEEWVQCAGDQLKNKAEWVTNEEKDWLKQHSAAEPLP